MNKDMEVNEWEMRRKQSFTNSYLTPRVCRRRDPSCYPSPMPQIQTTILCQPMPCNPQVAAVQTSHPCWERDDFEPLSWCYVRPWCLMEVPGLGQAANGLWREHLRSSQHCTHRRQQITSWKFITFVKNLNLFRQKQMGRMDNLVTFQHTTLYSEEMKHNALCVLFFPSAFPSLSSGLLLI